MSPENTSFPLPSDIGLKLGDSGKRVALLNARLIHIGYCSSEDADLSQFTEDTKLGIQIYQEAHNLDVTGTLSEETCNSLDKSRCGVYDLPLEPQPEKFQIAEECLYSNGNPWGRLELTYSVITSTSDLADDKLTETIKAAFCLWQESIPGLKFTRVEQDADIRISFFHGEVHEGEEESDAFKDDLVDLAHARDPYIGYCQAETIDQKNSRGDIHISDFANWKDGKYDLKTVLAHEIGHVLGLGHSQYENDLMYSLYTDVFDRLSSNDVESLENLYIWKKPIRITRGLLHARGGGKPHVKLMSVRPVLST